MPQFGTENVGKLAAGLIALEAADREDAIQKAALVQEKIDVGRRLVGKEAFGCIACHDLAGHPSTGARGPDLAASPLRVRYQWYRHGWNSRPGWCRDGHAGGVP